MTDTTDQPCVSIIMPCFNSEKYILAAITSIINQSFEAWELLVVDAGSSDNTKNIVQGIIKADPRVKFIFNTDDKGPAHARATGINSARGKYIAFLDADDLWDHDKLRKQSEFMQKNGHTFSYTKFNFLHEDGHLIENKMTDIQYTFSSALVKRGIGCLTVMISRELLTDNIISQNNKKHGEDYLWWLLIMRSGVRAYGLNETLASYRVTNDTLSSHKLSHYTTLWKTYRNDLSLSAWFVIRCFLLLALQKLNYRR